MGQDISYSCILRKTITSSEEKYLQQCHLMWYSHETFQGELSLNETYTKIHSGRNCLLNFLLRMVLKGDVMT
jgi:hypothetical protein